MRTKAISVQLLGAGQLSMSHTILKRVVRFLPARYEGGHMIAHRCDLNESHQPIYVGVPTAHHNDCARLIVPIECVQLGNGV